MLNGMRTTLDLDPDVLFAAKALAAHRAQTDARPHHELVLTHLEWRAQRHRQAARDAVGVLQLRSVLQEHRELVPAESRR